MKIPVFILVRKRLTVCVREAPCRRLPKGGKGSGRLGGLARLLDIMAQNLKNCASFSRHLSHVRVDALLSGLAKQCGAAYGCLYLLRSVSISLNVGYRGMYLKC